VLKPLPKNPRTENGSSCKTGPPVLWLAEEELKLNTEDADPPLPLKEPLVLENPSSPDNVTPKPVLLIPVTPPTELKKRKKNPLTSRSKS